MLAVEHSFAPYPGRGVLYAVDGEGNASWMYLITGRSDASRQRRIRSDDDRTLVVEPTMAAAEPDDLRHYRCARRVGGQTVVGNGDHVDVITDALAGRTSIEQAVELLEPEPDPPLRTPRIGLVIGPAHATIIAARSRGDGVERIVIDAGREPDTITMVTTYGGTLRHPVGSAPMRRLSERRPLAEAADAIWSALDPDLRVALVAAPASTAVPAVAYPEESEQR